MKTKKVIEIMSNYISSNDLLVSSLGRTAEEIYKNFDNDRVLFLDCLGATVGVGCGIALGLKGVKVFSIETDGSFMYSLSILNTLYELIEELSNFTIIVLDNKIYESAGGMISRTVTLDWRNLFKAWNLDIFIVKNCKELNNALNESLNKMQIIIVEIDNQNEKIETTKDIDGIESKYRFKRYINENLRKGIIKPCAKN